MIENLVPSELRVAFYLCQGLKSQTIANLLHISVKTVKNHLTSIYSKLGVRKRIEAIMIMLCWDERVLQAALSSH